MSIDRFHMGIEQQWGNVQISALAGMLSDGEIGGICETLGHRWRESPFEPPAVLRSMVYRALHSDKSIGNVVEDLAAEGLPGSAEAITESAWCQARSRLPDDLLPTLISRKAQEAIEQFDVGKRLFGRPVLRVDGTTISMPDTPELAEEFGYSEGKNGASRFPIARLTALLGGGIPVITDFRVDPYVTSEVEQFRSMLPQMTPKSIWVGDRYFSNYVNFHLSLDAKIDFISRLHQRRNGKDLARRGVKNGRDDWLVTLHLSAVTKRAYPEVDLPSQITVRLIRHRYKHKGKRMNLWIVTSLLNPDLYPRKDIIHAYADRWEIETHYGYLKTTLQMAILRSKRVMNIRKEIAAILLAHNLVWLLIYQSAKANGVSPKHISFTAAVRSILAFSPRLKNADRVTRDALYSKMLRRIAKHKNPNRPGRHEPRMQKREKRSKYPALRMPRERARRAA